MEVRKTYIGHDVHHAVRRSKAWRTGRHLPGSTRAALAENAVLVPHKHKLTNFEPRLKGEAGDSWEGEREEGSE
jgi:hypothetical protein